MCGWVWWVCVCRLYCNYVQLSVAISVRSKGCCVVRQVLFIHSCCPSAGNHGSTAEGDLLSLEQGARSQLGAVLPGGLTSDTERSRPATLVSSSRVPGTSQWCFSRLQSDHRVLTECSQGSLSSRFTLQTTVHHTSNLHIRTYVYILYGLAHMLTCMYASEHLHSTIKVYMHIRTYVYVHTYRHTYTHITNGKMAP